MNRGGGGSGAAARIGTAAGMMDHHSRLRRQQAEELGLEVAPAPPLRPPPREAVPWHHRSGPLGGGLNIISAEEHAAQMAAMPRVHMPGDALPSL